MNRSIASRAAGRAPGAPLRALLVLALLGVAFAIRWSVVDRDALWLDEGYSWWDAHQPLRALWTLVPTCDPHPPLYFATLHAWIAAFGDGAVAMRSLSTILGTATVGVVYAAGRRRDVARGRDAAPIGIGFVAAALFALTPFQAYFSVEARPYALLCFAASLLAYGCLASVRVGTATGAGRRAWIALVAGGAMALWTNNTAVLLLASASVGFVALWIVDAGSRRNIPAVIAAGVAVALLWAPDVPVLLEQTKELGQGFWIAKPSVAALTYELHWLVGLDSFDATWWIVLAAVGGLVAIGRRIGWRWAAMVAALAVLPIVLNVVVSAAMSPILLARALIGATPAISIALAAAAMLVRQAALRWAVSASLVVAHAVALAAYLEADHVKEPWKPIVARLAAETDGGPVLVVPDELVLPLGHEAERQRVSLRTIGVPADYPAPDLPDRYPSGKCAPSVVGTDLAPLVARLREERIVVLITRAHNTYDPDDAVVAALKAAGYAATRDDRYQPGDLRVLRFVRGDAS